MNEEGSSPAGSELSHRNAHAHTAAPERSAERCSAGVKKKSADTAVRQKKKNPSRLSADERCTTQPLLSERKIRSPLL